jgi:ribosomal protein L11 methyltransferase
VLSGVLRPLLASFRAALAPGGRLILGGVLQEEADEMISAAAAAGLALRVEDVEAEWWGALFAGSED